MSRSPLLVAEWLLASGAGASVRSVLGAMRGAAANRLRAASEGSSLRPGVYALVALPEGGAALPLCPSLGVPRASDPAFREACRVALEIARQVLEAPSLPVVRFEFEEWFAISGPSIALPAVLAFLAYFAPDHAPMSAIVATGGLTEQREIVPVGGMTEKLAIAEAEQGVAQLIVPSEHAPTRLDDVLTTVFGPGALRVDRSLLRLDELLKRGRSERDWARGAAVLEAIVVDSLPPADRARVLLERGTLLRHAGRSDEAASLHAGARELLVRERRVVGAEVAERYELECWLSAMDAFDLERVLPELEARLREPFLSLKNELRCRGMLAQTLGMCGRFAEAVEIRAQNLPLHERSEDLRNGRAGTLCPLALDAARAGDPGQFERYLDLALASTSAADEGQGRYTAAAALRGLVRLERHREALDWSSDRIRLHGVRPPAGLVQLATANEPISSHPELSTARALCRALRREGRAVEAERLSARVRIDVSEGVDLVAWLGEVTHIEGALARHDLADDAWRVALAASRKTMLARHPAASSFHGDLIAHESPDLLEAAIDRVWY